VTDLSNDHDSSDDALVVRGARGDREALHLLVERWERPVFAFIVKMVGSREDAQDLTQEVFVRVCRSAHRYRPSGRFQSWILRIAGNIVRTRLRRRRILRWVRFDAADHDSPSTPAANDASLEKLETRRTVHSALLDLPDRQRRAIALRYFDELSYQEVADAMGVSVSAVDSLLHRALAALRQNTSLKESGK